LLASAAPGVCAALEAKSRGADVLAVDRFAGGGATAVSGGVYYGGGTKVQKEAGIEDNAEELYKYLKLETQGVIKDDTLRKFCDDNSSNLDWLTGHGVPFGGPLYAKKTVYPPEGYFLYYFGQRAAVRLRGSGQTRGPRATAPSERDFLAAVTSLPPCVNPRNALASGSCLTVR